MVWMPRSKGPVCRDAVRSVRSTGCTGCPSPVARRAVCMHWMPCVCPGPLGALRKLFAPAWLWWRFVRRGLVDTRRQRTPLRSNALLPSLDPSVPQGTPAGTWDARFQLASRRQCIHPSVGYPSHFLTKQLPTPSCHHACSFLHRRPSHAESHHRCITRHLRGCPPRFIPLASALSLHPYSRAWSVAVNSSDP